MKTKHLLLILLLAAIMVPRTAMAQKTHIASTSTSTTMTWEEFASYVNVGFHCNGLTIFLDEDITTSTMVGTNSTTCFSGTFEGNGHTLTFNRTTTEEWTAPFRYLNGATIRNLKVDGTITTSVHRCAGLAGACFGNNTITNCLSDITINSSFSGDGSHGGFISFVSGGTTTIEGCAFTGRLLGGNTISCGGFIGWNDASVTFNNCVFAPTQITIQNVHSATFGRRYVGASSVFNINNCYYTYNFNDGTNHVGQGKLRYTVTAESPVTVVMDGTVTNYDASHITAYSGTPGLLYNGTIIAGSGEQLSLNLHGGGSDYYTDHGTLTGSANPYTLTMVAYNTVIFRFLYRENFDYYINVNPYLNPLPTSRILPTGWTAINNNTHDAQFPCMVFWGNNSDLWVSHPNSLLFYVAPEDNNDIYAIMPAMNTIGKQVMMYAGNGGDFTVGLMTNPTDANTFVACSQTYVTASDTPRQLILCTLTGQGNYVAVKYSKNASGTAGYIDNVVVYDCDPITVLDATYGCGGADPTSTRLPFDNTQNSSGSRQIYTTDELGNAGIITSIGFMKTDRVSASLNLTIYMVSTDQSTVNNSSQISYNSDNCVFNGVVDFTRDADWYEIPLDNPFYYDGVHNVCIIVELGASSNESMTFHCITTSTPQAIVSPYYYYQKNNLMFTKVEGVNICTNLTVSPHYTSADLSWDGVPGAQSYTVRYMPTEALGTTVYTEGFENGMDGWSLVDGYEGSGITTNAAEAHSGNCYFAFKGYWSGTSYTQYLVSPQLPNLSEGSTLEVYCRSEAHYDSFSFDVGVSSTDNQTSSFNWIATWTSGEYWNRCAVTIPAETKYICIRRIHENVRRLFIDDISIRNPVEWQTATTDLPNLQLTGLSAATEYKAQVKSNLPVEVWSNIIRFTTQDAPTNLQCTSVDVSSATLNWADDYTPEAWQICINGNENNLIEATEKPYTLTNLTPMTSYTAKVRGRTGAELGEWSNEIVINTAQEPVSLPYSTDFETASDWYLINGNLTNAWVWGEAAHNGEGTHSLYISNDGGATHTFDNSSAATVYAVKAFNLEAGIHKITFDWKANGSSFNFMTVALVPTGQNIVAEPSGTISSDSWIAVSGHHYGSTEWQTDNYEVPISSPDIYNLVFIWRNSGFSGSNPPAAIDNLSITVCECPRPVNFTANVVEGTYTAELSWTEMGEATQWQVCLDDEDNLIDVTTNPCTLTGLTFDIMHTAKVRANCGDSQSDWSDLASFEITQKIILSGSNSFNDNRLPLHNKYKYSLTQQIYTAEELGEAGLIMCIDFQKTTNAQCVRNIDIYMLHTDKDIFESKTDWIQVTNADLVFSGTVNFSYDVWTTITLATPFNYDGQHNVALIVDDNTGTNSSLVRFSCFQYDTTDPFRAIVYYNDGTNYDPKGTPGEASSRMSIRSKIRIMKVVNHTTEIAGYGTGNGNWYLIASPFAAPTDPTDVTNMLSNAYDLYRFNQSVELEWENWKQEGDNYHFSLENGRGYLYANSANVTLGFSGMPYNGNGQVTLSKDANAPLGQWNLIGNPLSTNATLGSKPFYIMNEYGTEIIAADNNHNVIAPMQGVFVQAESDGEIVTFTAQVRDGENDNEGLVLNLSQGNSAPIDRVIVRFGEGETLHKLQIRDGNPKIYIPQDNEEYAIVSANGHGELPVNFMTNENGTYTLSAHLEGVEMEYLHLIDNMTGADVDLLQTPEYTFSATKGDNESRFKLVF